MEEDVRIRIRNIDEVIASLSLFPPLARALTMGKEKKEKTFSSLPEESGKQGFCFSPLRCMGF